MIYNLQKNEVVCSGGMYIFQMYSLLFGIKHVLAKLDFFHCGNWLYVSVVLSLYTHGRIHGFCIKGLILVGGGERWLVRLVGKPSFLVPRLLLCSCNTYI